jgi:hypothetical protein
MTIAAGVIGFHAAPALAQPGQTVPRINVPFRTPGAPDPSRAIMWFGSVSPETNYADIRSFYREDEFYLELHIVDRRLWRDTSPSAADLTMWDSLYLDLDAGPAETPDSETPDADSLRFVKQLGDAAQTQAGYRWMGNAWTSAALPFQTVTQWRGDTPNNAGDDQGWMASFTIPFAGLGLAGPPPAGSIWLLALVLHDRDAAAGPALPDQSWPAQIDAQRPATWGELHFGLPGYAPEPATAAGVVSIRQGVDHASVVDAHVGGHTTCGAGLDYWRAWGEANYAGYTQVNIQNQRDIADFPCFSKYFVTVPLDPIPAEKAVISATLTLFLFGNAGCCQPGNAQPSMIEALTVAGGWDESTISWNHAPAPLENLGSRRVQPVDFFDPGVPYTWDVSRAVAAAYAQGEPLNLAFYSADGEYHSGKYFWSSDADQAVRPLLQVTWWEPVDSPGPDPIPGGPTQIWLPLLVQ